MLDNENKIISQAQAGHSDSFGQLYDYYHEQIFRFIFLKTSHREEAEDLTHQVFLSAWKNIKGYEQRQLPFQSWLYQIARNKVIDYYRVKKQNFSLDLVANTALNNDNLELLVDNRLELDKIRHALGLLTPEQQDVLIMRFIEDMPIKEVALAIGKTAGAVKLIQFRAIGKLKEILNNQNGVNH